MIRNDPSPWAHFQVVVTGVSDDCSAATAPQGTGAEAPPEPDLQARSDRARGGLDRIKKALDGQVERAGGSVILPGRDPCRSERQNPQHGDLLAIDHRSQPTHPGADQGHGMGVGGVDLATLSGREDPGPGESRVRLGQPVRDAG